MNSHFSKATIEKRKSNQSFPSSIAFFHVICHPSESSSLWQSIDKTK
jgi:hypothetical protein